MIQILAHRDGPELEAIKVSNASIWMYHSVDDYDMLIQHVCSHIQERKAVCCSQVSLRQFRNYVSMAMCCLVITLHCAEIIQHTLCVDAVKLSSSIVSLFQIVTSSEWKGCHEQHKEM